MFDFFIVYHIHHLVSFFHVCTKSIRIPTQNNYIIEWRFHKTDIFTLNTVLTRKSIISKFYCHLLARIIESILEAQDHAKLKSKP